MGEGSKVAEAIRVQFFDDLPSPQAFCSRIEPSNVPAVFRRAVKEWKAFSKWDPARGGLDYLQEQVGSVVVEAMLSRSAPIFYGDLRSHERVPLPFSTFVSSCKLCQHTVQTCDPGHDVHIPSGMTPANPDDEYSSALSAPTLGQVYLAQVPIFSTERKERSALETLKDDLDVPSFLETKQLISINLWMNATCSRSSTHYDPHHNLLCVFAGCKKVVLWPPSASPLLYPMPIYGEASNHSAVDIMNPDLSCHTRSKDSMYYCQTVVLEAGDALYLPEGWFHQVDSENLTIAVNFWWQSDIMSNMLEHMDSYYLRRILNRLVGKQMDQMLHMNSNAEARAKENPLPSNETSKGNGTSTFSNISLPRKSDVEDIQILDDPEPSTCQAFNALISLVHHNIGLSQNQIVGSTDLGSAPKHKLEGSSNANLHPLEDDPVASLLWSLKPLALRKILLTLVRNFPRTLEALVLHVLSPTAAEVLTRKFDEMDRLTTKDQQNEFYQLFYSVFDDQFAVMDALLIKKESFAYQAFKNVLDQYLGATIEQPK